MPYTEHSHPGHVWHTSDLPTNGEEFALTLDELQEVSSIFSDPSYVPQDDLESHLTQQNKAKWSTWI